MEKKSAPKSKAKASPKAKPEKSAEEEVPTVNINENPKYVPTFLVNKKSEEAMEARKQAQGEQPAEAPAAPATPSEAAAAVSSGQTEETQPATAEPAAPAPAETAVAPAQTEAPAETVDTSSSELQPRDSSGFSFSSLMENRKGEESVVIAPKDNESVSSIGKERKIKPFYMIVGFLFVLILIALALLLISRNSQSKPAATGTNTPTTTGTPVPASAIDQIYQFNADDIIPATVTDAAVLKALDQNIFAKAANDDKLYMFVSDKKLIIFRPSLNKIIDFAIVNDLNVVAKSKGITLDLDTDLSKISATVTPETDQVLTIQIRNGTNTSGITLKVQTSIEALGDNFKVTNRTNASAIGYPTTKIYKVSGLKADLVDQLAEKLGLTIEDKLPTAEAASTADVVIIVGADKVQ